MRDLGVATFALCLGCAVAPAAGGEVTGFVLIDAATDRDIRPLTDGATVNHKADGGQLNVRAEVAGKVGSVVFAVDGQSGKTESTAPFALAGDTKGDYSAWRLGPGKHTLTATPFPRAKAGGEAGKALRITFTIVGRAAAAPKKGRPPTARKKLPPPAPVPPAATMKAGAIEVGGEMKKWHKVTIAFAGPASSETAEPNPFTDYRLNVTFRSGETTYVVPGCYGADGRAARTGAAAGNVWKVHFCPDQAATWSWKASFRKGAGVAVAESADAGETAGHFDGATGTFEIGATDKTGRDHRGKGRLRYVGKRYLRFAETGRYFLKQGADAPENLLAYADFDGGFKADGQKDNLIKKWAAHVGDWREGDPTWRGGRGKGLIGAVNYLAGEGMNAISFLTLNIGGDDRNVFPYLTYDERSRMDVSRLDQWEIVFEHMDRRGIYLHFKTQETENEMLLDDGETGPQRKLYYRELIARFGHHLALNWNLGEENGALGKRNQSTPQRQAMARYFHDHDPYRHLIVIHNGKAPADLLGEKSKLTGYSLQTSKTDFRNVHGQTLQWVNKSAATGRPWVVACDEPGDASHSLLPDSDDPAHNDGRANGLWGCIMAGGAGNEWYFGYKHAHSDLTCEDWRSRDLWWDQCRIALAFFEKHLPFWEMASDDGKTAAKDDYCFCKPGEVYAIYLRNGRGTKLDLTGAAGTFEVRWYDPRKGGELQSGSVRTVRGGAPRDLGRSPNKPDSDWVVLVRKAAAAGR